MTDTDNDLHRLVGRRITIRNKNKFLNGRTGIVIALEYHRHNERGAARPFYRVEQMSGLIDTSYLLKPQQVQGLIVLKHRGAVAAPPPGGWDVHILAQ